MKRDEKAQPVLEMQAIYKSYNGAQALNGAHIDLRKGEVHALVGENGAGKSTMIKIIMGVVQADAGKIILDGEEITIGNPQEAQAHGIAAIYQEPMVFPDLNVAENIFISHASRGAIVNWNKLYADAEDILSKLDVQLNVRMPARGLTLAAQQAVEIAKAISLKVRILIMDEPTSSLSAHEVNQLFKIVRALRDRGVSILFIGHRLEEVFELADRITVFRDGCWISTRTKEDVKVEGVIREMVGREMSEFFVKESTDPGKTVLEVKNLRKANVFENINFNVRRGEVLGFAGLIGSRRTDVGLALFGIAPADSGETFLKGKKIQIHSTQQALQAGIAYASEDRRQLGLIMPMSIAANISLPLLKQYLKTLGLVDRAKEDQTTLDFKDRLNIQAQSIRDSVERLSGGNQQKVMLSKWLNASPDLLILDEPTRGVDVGAKAEVHKMINDLTARGIAIILISSDLPEVIAMSDRVLVMREGKQMGIFEKVEADQERIMSAAMGQNRIVEEVLQ